jgi:hypothetical protein
VSGERAEYGALLPSSATLSATPSATVSPPGATTSAPIAASPLIAIRISVGVLMMIAAGWLGAQSRRRQTTSRSNSDDSGAEWFYDI